ncbi:hypothetical protein SAMN05216564_1167 [Halopenitus persicus]|uniref:Uncharacterized protein n=2 Tax=Halopenitus persicus TaxID=1048396 RepID=A0A1H3NVZ9_9EURY|nr:hypothetical protein SAMN05216564_1167 [Halopenitus persicus]
MDQFGEENRIPYFNVEEGDVGVIAGIPIFALFVASLTGMESLALPLVIGGAAVGVSLVYLTPEHLNAWRWISDISHYVKRPQRTFSAPSNPQQGTNETEQNEGGLRNYSPFEPDERTQDLTHIHRAWPGAGAIEREDGAMEAYLEVTPGNMDFAMADDWAQLQAAGTQYANNELKSKLKFHATTRAFPVERVTQTIEERLTDEDVKENPIFENLLEEYRETRPREMRERGTQQIQFYLGVEVTPLEIYGQFTDEKTPVEKLTQIPIIGFLFNPLVTRREDFSTVQRRIQMFEKLDDRISTVQSEFVQQASGWSSRRLSTVELFALSMDFWNGREHSLETASNALRENPVVGRSQREGVEE